MSENCEARIPVFDARGRAARTRRSRSDSPRAGIRTRRRSTHQKTPKEAPGSTGAMYFEQAETNGAKYPTSREPAPPNRGRIQLPECRAGAVEAPGPVRDRQSYDNPGTNARATGRRRARGGENGSDSPGLGGSFKKWSDIEPGTTSPEQTRIRQPSARSGSRATIPVTFHSSWSRSFRLQNRFGILTDGRRRFGVRMDGHGNRISTENPGDAESRPPNLLKIEDLGHPFPHRRDFSVENRDRPRPGIDFTGAARGSRGESALTDGEAC